MGISKISLKTPYDPDPNQDIRISWDTIFDILIWDKWD